MTWVMAGLELTPGIGGVQPKLGTYKYNKQLPLTVGDTPSVGDCATISGFRQRGSANGQQGWLARPEPNLEGRAHRDPRPPQKANKPPQIGPKRADIQPGLCPTKGKINYLTSPYQ
ncbi:unnamed protein product [Spodoptera exigua]|nr:unnamed protein product [Spodoptera exigua]